MATRSRSAAVALLALVLGLLVLPAPAAMAQGAADVSIIKDNEAPSNGEIAARLSEETDLAGTVDRVVISRDDDFADALASGLLQADSPLLLVPRDGPVPDRVLGEIQRLGASDAVVLGGSGAVAPAVDVQLTASGLSVERRQGGSRIETAVEIARADAPGATTAILARAFPLSPADPTQGFADALGAGSLAASNGWPILLSDTGTLSEATRAYLAASDIREIKLVGGTAALSAEVEASLQALGIQTDRIAGDSRGATALEVAKELGAETAADVTHVILADGTGADAWAGGFASARRAAVLDAPILLGDGVRLLPQTIDFLTPGATFAQAGELTVTCVVHPLACTDGRQALGLIDVPVLSVDPPRGVLVAPGQVVTLTLSPASEGADVNVLVDGTCLDGSEELVTDGSGSARVTLTSALPPSTCAINVTYGSTDGLGFNRASIAYPTEPPGVRTADQAFVASSVVAFGVVPQQPVFVTDSITCAAPGGQPTGREAWAMQAQQQQAGAAAFDAVSVGSEPVVTTPDAACTISIVAPPQVSRVFWGLYATTDAGLRNPLALGTGSTATFDLAQVAAATGVDVRDVSVAWIVEVADPRPAAPQPPPPGLPGIINNPDGLPLVCDGVPLGSGIQQAPVGATCTAASPTADFNVLLAQPDAVNVSAQEVTFTALAETRWTTIRAQFLARPGGGGTSCAAADPVEVGRAAGGAVLEPEVPGYHTFEGRAGDSLRVRLVELLFSGLDPYLTILGPDGREIASNDDAEGSLNSRLDVTLEEDGIYCVVAGGFSTSIGDYLLSVDPAPFFVEDQFLDEEIPAFAYDLTDAAAGEEVVLEMRAADDVLDPYLEVQDLAGNVLAADDDGGGGLDSRIEWTIPAAGDYVVVASGFGGTLGDYTIEVSSTLPGQAFAATTDR